MILGALGEFWGILGAALETQKLILGMQNSILGLASHDLSNMKTTILRATPGAIPGIDGNPHERFHLTLHSRCGFSRIGVVPAHQNFVLIAPQCVKKLHLESLTCHYKKKLLRKYFQCHYRKSM